MAIETAFWNSFTGGWSPNDDPINGGKSNLLQMDNLELDKNGSLSLQDGCTVLRTVGASSAHTLFSQFLSGSRFDYLGFVDGTVYRNSTLLNSSGSTTRTGFAVAFNDVLITSGSYRVKDDGVNDTNLGIIAPTAAPTLTTLLYYTPPLIADATDVNGYHGVTATLVNVGGFDYLTQWQPDATDFLFVYATYDSANTTNTNVLTQTNLGSTTTPSDPNDFFEVDLFTIDGSGNPDNSGTALGGISSIQFALYASHPSSLSPTIEFASDYFTYTWSSSVGPNGDDVVTVSGSKITFRIRRAQFQRIGSDATKDWSTIVGYVIGIQCTGAFSAPAGITINQVFQGGRAGMISGTNGINVQYAQMNIAKTASYTGKSTLGPAVQVQNIYDVGFAVQPQVPTDPQVNEIWIFRQDNNLGEWYRTIVIPLANDGVPTIDIFNDVDALTLDITVNLNLVSTGVAGVSDDILQIIGPISGRWYYFTSQFLYPSDINDPDLTNVALGIRTCGSGSEVFLWAAKISDGVVLVGTSVNIYLLTGTFTTLPDGSVDIFYRPLGCKFPPLSKDYVIFSGTVYYISKAGWTSINQSGGNQIIVAPNTDLLYRGETRYEYAGITLPGNAPGSINYPCDILKGKLYCVVTGTGRVEVYDLVRQYWRPVLWGLGDISAIYATQDGQMLGYYPNGNKLRVINDQTTKLIDGTTNQSVNILTPVQDGSMPRNRKDASTFKSRVFTSGANLSITLITDIGTFVLGNINTATTDIEDFLDISDKVSDLPFKYWQYLLTGTFPEFLLEDCSLDFDPRPTPVTYIKGRNNNFGTGSKKRVRTWPFLLDSLGVDATITPIVDNIAQTAFTFNTNDKTTCLVKFNDDQFGIDYGYKIKSPTGEIEFYGDMSPEIVQVLPIAKRFDQLGPIEIFRYGKFQKLDVRIFPLDDGNAVDFILQLPWQIYIDDIPLQNGLIPVLNKREASYTIGLQKGTAGAIMRLELGPTSYDMHRFDIRLLTNKSGDQTEGQWIKLG